MKDNILHSEKSHTKEGSHEFYTGAIVPAGLAIFPVDTIDVASNETTAQIDAQENVDHALGKIPTNWLKPFFITTEKIDALENVDNTLGLILPDDINETIDQMVEFIGEGDDVMPWPMTTAQIDAQENVGMVPNSPNEPIIILDSEGFTTPVELEWVDPNWTIDPVTGSYIDYLINEPSVCGLYIDNPETGLRSLQMDQNPAPTSQIAFTPSHVQAEDMDPNLQKIIDFYKQHTAEASANHVLLAPNQANANANANVVDADLQKIIDYYTQYAANPVNNSDNSMPILIAQAPEDLISAYTLTATKGNDLIIGNATNDKLSGLAGNDTLDGALGNDVLNGGVGNDVLIGGAGKDKLTGGAGADTFKFASSNESTFWSMDTITDFKHAQGDKIDLSAIDSNANVAGDQGFTLVSAFSADATGQLYFDAKTHILYGSNDADSAPEFAITLNGVNTLLPADFIF
ncbi:MAG: type I secretion C-terminal target domain-containing protein [Methylococcales bacterium]